MIGLGISVNFQRYSKHGDKVSSFVEDFKYIFFEFEGGPCSYSPLVSVPWVWGSSALWVNISKFSISMIHHYNDVKEQTISSMLPAALQRNKCAFCIEELTGIQLLRSETIKDNIKHLKMNL